MSKTDAARKIEEAFERTGVRRTPQRFFVLEHLLTHADHATVEDLFSALNRRHARASRATVYNTLHALVEAGLVREFTLDGKAARYDANLDRHHHFVCDGCGSVEDIDWFEIPSLNGSNSARHRIRTYEVIVRSMRAMSVTEGVPGWNLPGWNLVDGHHLHKVFHFPDFVTALDFVNRIGAVAEQQGHHPDLLLSWGKVEVTTLSHSADGITEKDYALAAAIDRL